MQMTRNPYVFRFEVSWVLEPSYQEVVEEVWGSETHIARGLGEIQEKLVRCRSALADWNGGRLSYEEDIQHLT